MQKQADFWAWDHSDLHIKFQTNWGFVMKLLQITTYTHTHPKNNKTKTPKQ